ncbi:MAG: DUF5676 family membrane protein [Candidatus Roizmanbacteria bacterium]|nr:DUF5676 family membrane protein [Candidatus Roizmanbacteria bacterium]
MKHDVQATANATAVTIAIVYVVCALAIMLLPDLSMNIAQSWFHGVELSEISELTITVSSFILGLVTSTAGGWLLGYVFASAYNYFIKK